MSSGGKAIARTPWLLLGATLLLALGLRTWGIDFGLPLLHARPDESTIVDLALRLGPGQWNPRFFQYPSLQIYWVAGLRGIQSVFVAAPEPASLYLLARITSALFGTATVVCAFAIARTLAGPLAGWVAAFFLAIVPLHVRDSHFLTVDVAATFLGVAAIALLLRFRDRRRVLDLCVSGLLLGLASSTKYNLALFAAAYPVVLWPAAARGAEFRRFARRLGIAGALALLAFGLTTPFSWLDPGTFLADLAYEREHFFAGHATETGAAWLHHLRFSLLHGLGPPLFVASAFGSGWLALQRRDRASLGVLAAIATYAAVAGTGRTAFARYVIPILPLLCVASAVGLAEIVPCILKGRPAWQRPVVVGLALLIGLPSLWTSLQLDQRLARKDTRVQTREWIEAHIAQGTRIAVEGSPWGLPSFDGYEVFDLRAGGLGPAGSSKRQGPYDASDLADARIEWVVLQNHPLPYSRVSPGLRRDLVQAGPAAAEFTPFAQGARPEPGHFDLQDAFYLPLTGLAAVERPGPKLWVYRLDAAGRPAALESELRKRRRDSSEPAKKAR